MTTKPVHIGATNSFHVQPILSGRVGAPGLEYRATATKTIDEATMGALRGEFDVAEMSLATFVKFRETDDTLVGLPIFARKLVSQYAFVREGSTLNGHASLKGKRVAVPQFWLTAALWHRWFVQQYGVDPKDVVWCPLAADRIEGMRYDGYQVDWSLKGKGQAAVVQSGEADCFIYARRPLDMSGLQYLSRDPAGDAVELTRRTGFVPATHVIVIRQELLRARPELAGQLFQLFAKALKHASLEVAHEAAQFLPLGDFEQDRTRAVLGADWNAYGWANSEAAVKTFCDAAVEQGMVARVDMDGCFVRSVE